MSRNLVSMIAAKAFVILSILLSVHSLAFAKDPAVGRDETMQKNSEADIAAQTLRFKIVRSRMFILRMQDILPAKGNPYYHMADFAAKSTLPAYKEAQKPTAAIMNDSTHPAWLPVKDIDKISTEEVSDSQLAAPVINYFAQYIATANIMENLIQPVLKKSIIISSVEESIGQEGKAKFDEAWKYIKYMSTEYTKYLNQPATQGLMDKQGKKVTLMVIGTIAKGMINYLDYIANEDNKNAVKNFITSLSDFSNLEPTKDNVSAVKAKIKELTDLNSPDFKKVKKALDSVDLPETGDIDGADEAFEIAMRLEVGFDILKTLFNHINENW